MYRCGNREQISLFPPSIEEYVTVEDPVRAYDAFVEALNLSDLGIDKHHGQAGNAPYDPKAMLKLMVYGPSYGWLSSRKLERATHHNVSFMWLMGGLRPDHKTISEFRRRNKEAIKKVMKQCARLCIKLDLIEGNILFVDGTKIRANAGRDKSYSREHYEKSLKKIDERIDELFNECEQADEAERDQESWVKMGEELKDKGVLRSKIEDMLNQFKREEEDMGKAPSRINQTDPDCSLMRSIQGSHASYNVQSVVDDKHGLIVNTDVVSEATDVNQFTEQIVQAEGVTGKECKVASADAGYANTENLEKIDGRGTTKVIVPSQRQALHEGEDAFSKSHFTYNKEGDCYYCPEGKKLHYRGKFEKGSKLAYDIGDGSICRACKNYGMCTKAKNGRRIIRLAKEELKEKLERQYDEAESQEIYARRKTRVEHPFGHIKRNLGLKNFLLRGREAVKAEVSIAGTCFNIARMITIFGGVQAFIERISQVKL